MTKRRRDNLFDEPLIEKKSLRIQSMRFKSKRSQRRRSKQHWRDHPYGDGQAKQRQG
jgi:hypothetical protein